MILLLIVRLFHVEPVCWGFLMPGPVTEILRLASEFVNYSCVYDDRSSWVSSCVSHVMRETGGRHDPEFVKRLVETEYPECD